MDSNALPYISCVLASDPLDNNCNLNAKIIERWLGVRVERGENLNTFFFCVYGRCLHFPLYYLTDCYITDFVIDRFLEI